jgi:hypothetical protein
MAILSDLGSCSLETLLTGGALIKTRVSKVRDGNRIRLGGCQRTLSGGIELGSRE